MLKNKNEITWSLLWLGAIIATSFSVVFGKLLMDTMPIYTFLAIWNLVLMLIVLVIYWLKNLSTEIKNHSKKEIFILIIIWSLMWIVVPLLYYNWLQKTYAINVVLISRLEPVFAWIIGILRIWEKFSRTKLLSMLIMFFWVSIVVTKWYSNSIDINLYDILIVLAALVWAFGTNTIKKYLSKTEDEIIVFVKSILWGLFFLTLFPILFKVSTDIWISLDQKTLILIFLYSIIVLFLWDLFWFKALKKIPISRLSLISLTYPIFGILFSYLILWERIYSFHIYWLIIILIWLWLGFLHKKKHNLFHKSEKFHNIRI